MLADVWRSERHTVIDLGDDAFTRGRPHPMIDQTLRKERILKEAADPEVAVILFDVVLGYGAHPDPAPELAEALKQARAVATAAGRQLALVGSVCGTAGDPQGLARQEEALRAAGVLLAESNAQAVRLAATVAAAPGVRRGPVNPLFEEQLQVVNVGLPAFADAILSAGGAALQVEWAPPGPGDPEAARRLADVINHPAIEAANRQAFAAYQAAQPVLEGIGMAGAVIPGMGERTILHAGPPIAWERMCGPMQGAIVGAILYEGWARSHADAAALAGRGEVEFAPCHHHGAVGPMAGVISPSMPVWIVVDREHGNRALLQPQRGPRQGAALRRQQPGGARAAALAGRGAGAGARCRAREPGRHRAEAADRAGAAHGRRGAQPQRRGVVAAAQAAGAGAAAHRHRARRDGGGHRVHRRQRSLLPQSVDGGVQGHAGCRCRRAEQQHGDRHGAERRRLRHPPQRHRRRLVHRAGAGGRRPVLPGLHRCRCGARPRRQRDHRDRGPRRLRDGRRARDRAVRRRHARRTRSPTPTR